MTTAETPVEHALSYAAWGWRVVPIRPGGKHPADVPRWQEAATTDADLIKAWWQRWPTHGVGIATGRASGVFVLDVDVSGNKAGDATLADLEATHGALPSTVETVTGSGGRHLYFRWPEGTDIRNDAGHRLGLGLDVRGEGGQVLAPPTVHPNGTAYAWESLGDPFDGVAPAEAPAWLLELLTEEAQPANPRADRATYTGEPRPGDKFAASVTWPQLLLADGAEFIAERVDHRSGHRYELWARPGCQADHGNVHAGATLYYGGTDLLKVHTTAWPGLEADKTYTRFGYFAATRYGGDHARAAAELRRRQGDDDIRSWVDEAPYQAPAPPAVASGTDEGMAPAPEGDETTWEPTDLEPFMDDDYEPIEPAVLRRADGRALLYAARTNVLMGESGGGKSWVALLACAEVLLDGGTAGYVDLEDHPRSIVDRLRALGVPKATIRARFVYWRPDRAAGPDALERIDRLIVEREIRVLVIDSVGEAMALQGLKQNDDDEVARWFRRVPKRWASLGPAVILVDHVPKDPDGPKLFAIGSQRKRAAVDGVQWRVDQVRSFAKGKPGALTLTCGKDRNGGFAHHLVHAEIAVDPSEDGKVVQMAVAVPEGRDAAGHVMRPTVLMERVSRWLELNPASSGRQIEQAVRGKSTAVRLAVKVLTDEGWVAPLDGGAKGILHSVVRPFREVEDLVDNPERVPASQARPERVPDAVSTTERGARPRVPPLVTDEGDGDAPHGSKCTQEELSASLDADPYPGLL